MEESQIALTLAIQVWEWLNSILDSPKVLSIGIPVFAAYYRHTQHLREVFKNEIKQVIYENCAILYSNAYESAEEIVFNKKDSGEQHIKIKRKDGYLQRDLGRYLDDLQKELSTFFRTPLPKKMIKMAISESRHYRGRKWDEYVQESGKRLYGWTKSHISKTLGSTDIVKHIFEKELSEEVFVGEYRQIVQRARSFKRRIV